MNPPLTQPPTHLLYLHGFRSSPQSFKARRLSAWLAEHRPDVHWWCPQLPPSPTAALALLNAGTAAWPATTAVMGSSLGGFYAAVMAEQRGWPAVLLNPAVDPARDLARHVGELQAFHDPAERFLFRPEFLEELRQIKLGFSRISLPQGGLAIMAKGDEVLDWREMSARYSAATIHLLEGGDHALSDFEALLPVILEFLKLCDSKAKSASSPAPPRA
ncbi:Esterase [Rubrivivax sp. A210]|uniref:YqiA/YcfP family alpha/beta fold hydrolase n=1 Tax=Rubrivivax sp. A210 TaxID=2772301 RepID=UPI00191B46FA|nr:YqiA/YcfP family alpha/beta fold hydrolase [Rubrivivax sp. A210]CAD5375272.1 Esterase [Rubrivivax sp. A210]